MPNRKLLGAAAMVGALGIGGVAGAALGTPGTSGAQKAVTTTTTPAPGGQAGPRGGPMRPRLGPFGAGMGFGAGGEMQAAAKALGITVQELGKDLRNGQSIADVAKAKGVSRQTVIDAMVAAAKAQIAASEAQLPARIAALVDGKRPAGPNANGPTTGGPGMPPFGRPGGFGLGFGRGQDLAVVAKALGITAQQLGQDLRNGQTIAAIAKSKGVAEQTVIDAVVAQAKTGLAAAVKAGRLTQAQADKAIANLPARIKNLVEGKRPAMGPGGMGGPGGFGPMGPGGKGSGGPGPH